MGSKGRRGVEGMRGIGGLGEVLGVLVVFSGVLVILGLSYLVGKVRSTKVPVCHCLCMQRCTCLECRLRDR